MAADDKFAALERLARLKADGIITDAEFATEKAAVLAGRTSAPTPMPPQVYTPAPPPPSSPTTIIYAPAPQGRGWVGRALRGAFVGLLVFIIIAVIGARSHGGSAGAAMVTCDSQDARDVMKDAFEHSVADRVTNVRLLDVANIVERSYDPVKAQRTCAADVTFNTGEQHVGYRLYKASNGQDLLLQTMDDPGPSAAPAPATTPASAEQQWQERTLQKVADNMPDVHGVSKDRQDLLAGMALAQALMPRDDPASCVHNPGVPNASPMALTCLKNGRRFSMAASVNDIPTHYHHVDSLPAEDAPDRTTTPGQQP